MNSRGFYLSLTLLCAGGSLLCAEQKAKSKWSYLDNGKVRIGVDRSRGACIGFLEKADQA